MEPTNTGYLVWRLSMKWRAAVDRAVAPWGLTHAQYSVLASLSGMSAVGPADALSPAEAAVSPADALSPAEAAVNPAPSQRELADVTGLDPIYVSKLVRALERDGLVDRATHPRDPRAVQLTLTPKGETTIGAAIATVRTLQEELTRPIGGPRGPRAAELARTLRELIEHNSEGEQP